MEDIVERETVCCSKFYQIYVGECTEGMLKIAVEPLLSYRCRLASKTNERPGGCASLIQPCIRPRKNAEALIGEENSVLAAFEPR